MHLGFTYRIEELVAHAEGHVAAREQPVGEDADADAEPPAGEVGQRGEQGVLLDVEVQDVAHVGGQLRQLGVEGPRLAALRHQNRPQRHARQHLPPRYRRRLLVILQTIILDGRIGCAYRLCDNNHL